VADWRQILPVQTSPRNSPGVYYKEIRRQNLRKLPDFTGATRKTATRGTIVTVSQIA